MLIYSCSSSTALIFVTSAFFLNKAISRLMFGSWYSMICVFLRKVSSYSVVLPLLCKKVADNWLKTLVF